MKKITSHERIRGLGKAQLLFNVFSVFFILLVALVVYYYQFNDADNTENITESLRPLDGNEEIQAFIVPENTEGKAIGIYSNKKDIVVYIDGELEYYAPGEELKAESVWHVVEIRKMEENAIVAIEFLGAPGENLMGSYQMIYGDYESVLEVAVSYSVISIISAIYFFVLGLIVVAVFMVWRGSHNNRNISWMGITLIVMSIWIYGADQFTGIKLFPVVIPTEIYMLCAFIMPIIGILWLRENVSKNEKKLCYFLIVMLIPVFLYAIYLAIVKGQSLNEMHWIVMIEFMGVMFLSIVIAIKNQIKGRGQVKAQTKKDVSFYVRTIFVFSIVTEYGLFVVFNSYEAAIVAKFITIIFFTHLCIEQIRKIRSDIMLGNDAKEQLLQMQNLALIEKMRPHFINNTLLSIQDLCYSDGKEAAEVIGIFSRYLMFTFQIKDEKSLVSIGSEIEHIDCYIEIEKLCYEDKIIYAKEILVEDVWVPPFLIQPIVENAVKHGILKKEGKGTISLKVYEEANELIIEVKDDGVGFDKTKASAKDRIHSTEIIEGRLKSLVGGNIKRESVIGKGTCVEIRIPNIEQYRGDRRKKVDEGKEGNNSR